MRAEHYVTKWCGAECDSPGPALTARLLAGAPFPKITASRRAQWGPPGPWSGLQCWGAGRQGHTRGRRNTHTRAHTYTCIHTHTLQRAFRWHCGKAQALPRARPAPSSKPGEPLVLRRGTTAASTG